MKCELRKSKSPSWRQATLTPCNWQRPCTAENSSSCDELVGTLRTRAVQKATEAEQIKENVRSIVIKILARFVWIVC